MRNCRQAWNLADFGPTADFLKEGTLQSTIQPRYASYNSMLREYSKTRSKAKRPHIQMVELEHEGPRAAAYPYNRLREIPSAEDARNAVLDETEWIEQEFGRDLVEPLYELIWVLNGAEGFFTSHTLIGSTPNNPPPFEWAKEQIASEIVMLTRHMDGHFDQREITASLNGLGSMLNSAPVAHDPTGWFIQLRPCRVLFDPEMILTTYRANYEEERAGFGASITVAGCASNRSKAARRWSEAVSFVSSAVRALQEGENLRRANPHRHLL